MVNSKFVVTIHIYIYNERDDDIYSSQNPKTNFNGWGEDKRNTVGKAMTPNLLLSFHNGGQIFLIL